ncbi:hypothetical protein NUU61_009162 [Penicillium alfredii]|uniref:Uncharacterized protein n=1 Tax=Penicillium alfredii TaxID=1506179 RepID=A0A9W9JWW3_9EURO|nr:uncharacterized protein NUU61_009162 [Penicillium alfredii]KAJ5084583.1 hypothetical protein NUU61_009162 [Penicillium alfredii]
MRLNTLSLIAFVASVSADWTVTTYTDKECGTTSSTTGYVRSGLKDDDTEAREVWGKCVNIDDNVEINSIKASFDGPDTDGIVRYWAEPDCPDNKFGLNINFEPNNDQCQTDSVEKEFSSNKKYPIKSWVIRKA